MLIQKRFKIILLLVNKSLVTALLCVVIFSQSSAVEMSHGEITEIIRTVGHPCANVLDLQSVGENSWKVKCKSGSFFVIRSADGQVSVTVSYE